MNLLFFLNCISPHQIPYIRELNKHEDVNDVIVIAPCINYAQRKEMGWNNENLLNTQEVRFIIAPSAKEVNDLYNTYQGTKTWCIYSGINAFKEIACWFRTSLHFNVKRGIITEPPLLYNHPLWQHAIRFALQDWKYVKYIDKFFVMGDEFLPYYKFWNKRWDVIPFLYCTEWRERSSIKTISGPLRVLYVGSLSPRKNVQCLLSAIQLMSEQNQSNLEIGIVGDGELRNDLSNIANHITATSIIFYGKREMSAIPSIMEQYDVLVLPSRHDGWGAVVNEALTLGLYTICSDHCGAKYLLKEQSIGLVFQSDNSEDLMQKICQCVNHKEEIRQTQQTRINWSKEHISGKAVADLFLTHIR